MSSSLTTPSVLDGERNRSKNWISVSQENVCWLVCHSVKSDVGSAGGVQQGGGQDDGDGGEGGGVVLLEQMGCRGKKRLKIIKFSLKDF